MLTETSCEGWIYLIKRQPNYCQLYHYDMFFSLLTPTHFFLFFILINPLQNPLFFLPAMVYTSPSTKDYRLERRTPPRESPHSSDWKPQHIIRFIMNWCLIFGSRVSNLSSEVAMSKGNLPDPTRISYPCQRRSTPVLDEIFWVLDKQRFKLFFEGGSFLNTWRRTAGQTKLVSLMRN